LIIKPLPFWLGYHGSFKKDGFILDEIGYFIRGLKKKELIIEETEGEEKEEEEVFLAAPFGKEKRKKEKNYREEEKKRKREKKRGCRKGRVKKTAKENT